MQTWHISSYDFEILGCDNSNHCTPSTTSAPPIGMESIGLFNTYSPMVILILWHFLEKFTVPPFATITWHFGVGYRKQFNSLATLQWIKLWVLPESINTITLFFLICPSILRFWGVVILSNALHDMVGLISSLSRVGSGVYPLLLKSLVHFLPPPQNLCKIIYSQHNYDL